jgi:hypothetical protein
MHRRFSIAALEHHPKSLHTCSHIRRLTAEHASPMPIIDIAHQHLVTTRALHAAHRLRGAEKFEVLDWSAIIAASRVAAGLEGFNSGKASFQSMFIQQEANR